MMRFKDIVSVSEGLKTSLLRKAGSKKKESVYFSLSESRAPELSIWKPMMRLSETPLWKAFVS